MPVRGLLLGLCLLGMRWPSTLAAQTSRTSPIDAVALQRLLLAEDARGTGAEGVTPLLDAMRGGDTLLRRLAVRGLGRFQRPEFGRRLLPLLRDSLPAMRAEAATAIAQSLRRVKRSDPVPDTSRLGARLGVDVATTPGTHAPYHDHPQELSEVIRPFLRQVSGLIAPPSRDRP